MAIVGIRIGSIVNAQMYDNALFDSAIETTAPMKAGAPVDPNDVLRLTDIAGYVQGPASATDNAVARFNGAGGKTIQNSGVILDDDDRLGIGVVPSAYLHLPAGEAAAGFAPLKFAAGVLLTTPEAGVMEFDGTGIYLTNTNHRRFISLASDSVIATVTATTVASTTLWTGITNANELKAQRVYVIKACGLYTTDAVDTATISLYMGATLIGSITTPVGAVTDGPWYLEIFLTVRTIGGAGTVSAFGRIDATTGIVYGVLESFVIDTTIANDLIIKCTWSDIGNSLKLTQCWLAVAD